MKEYVHGVNIADVERISSYYGSCDRASIEVFYKDGGKEKLTFITREENALVEIKKLEKELLAAYNEYNNIQETYILENEAYALINGEMIHFGTRCETINKEYKLLTLKEIEELRKQFKIKDNGFRHLALCIMLQIKGNRIINKVPKRYIEQLEYMGYDTSLLEYELKEDD